MWQIEFDTYLLNIRLALNQCSSYRRRSVVSTGAKSGACYGVGVRLILDSKKRSKPRKLGPKSCVDPWVPYYAVGVVPCD